MKIDDVKVGQVIGAVYPYSDEPTRKYGYRVLKTIEKYDGGGDVYVQDVKTGEKGWHFFIKDDAYTYDRYYSDWTLIEDVP